MDGIETQAIDVEIADPKAGIVDEELPHGIAAGIAEIDRVAPGCVVAIREIGPEAVEITSFWPEMVVDDIEKHGEAATVRRIDEPLQSSRPAVRILDGIGMNAVEAPIPLARKLSDWHQLDRRDSKRGQFA